MKRKILLLIVVLSTTISLSAANSAVNWSVIADTSTGLPQTAHGRLVWGDFNNDGYKDAFIIAGNQAILFKNNGDDTFSKVQDGFFDVLDSASAVFIDYDNDGNLDLVTVGCANNSTLERKAYVYHNTGASNNNPFEKDNTRTNQLTGTCTRGDSAGRMIEAFDYNNDGWTDLLIMGYFEQDGDAGINEQQYAYLYKNVEGDFYQQTNIIVDAGNFPVTINGNFPTMTKGSVHVGDVNNDGYSDILMQGTGWVHAPWSDSWGWWGSYLYTNNQDGTFSMSSYSQNLNTNEDYESVFTDIDGDGNVDIIEISKAAANVHFGYGDGTFTKNTATGLLMAWGASITTGDVNNDGLMDILISAGYESNLVTKLFYNNGDKTLTPVDVDAAMRGRSGSVALPDIDGDGTLDFSNFGWLNGWPTVFAKNELNTGISANTAPSVPTNFAVSFSGGKFSFSWVASTDDFTPTSALRYNIYAKNETTGKIYAYAPADIATGRLKIGGSIVPLIAKTSFELTLPDGIYTFGVQAVDQSDVGSRFVTYNYPDPDNYTWTGSDDDDWHNIGNWETTTNGDPVIRIPASNTIVTIPAGLSNNYPVLQTNALAKEIRFEAGAEIGNQHLLTYDKAYVQYDFKTPASSPSLFDRWNMLAVPLQEVYSGDFTFGGYPFTYVNAFKTVEAGDVTYGGWAIAKKNNEKLEPGDGFALWIDSEDYTTEKGLGKAGGIIELPYYEQSDADIRHTHEYSNRESKFYHFKDDGNGEYIRNDDKFDVAVRDAEKAYKLVNTAPFEKSVSFGAEQDASPYFALIGNPFMTTIDFDALSSDNANKIKPYYQVWTGAGYAGYTKSGNFGATGLDQYIAPMQSFIVEKAEDYTAGKFVFNSTAGATGEGELRSSANNNTGNKLDITATNNTASVLTFIASRPEGGNTFGNRDARKLLAGLNDVPEIYTLKESAAGGNIAVGANVVNVVDAEQIIVPIGLATSYSGPMTLTFEGMDNYDANIHFLDIEEEEDINLSQYPSYQYNFNHTGNEDNPVDGRFFIAFSPKNITGMQDVLNSGIRIYAKDNSINIVSAFGDFIKQVFVYNLNGSLIYAHTNANAAYTFKAPLSGYIPEICIVRVVTEKGTKSVKLHMKHHN